MNDSLGQTQEKQAYINTKAIKFDACQKWSLVNSGLTATEKA